MGDFREGRHCVFVGCAGLGTAPGLLVRPSRDQARVGHRVEVLDRRGGLHGAGGGRKRGVEIALVEVQLAPQRVDGRGRVRVLLRFGQPEGPVVGLGGLLGPVLRRVQHADVHQRPHDTDVVAGLFSKREAPLVLGQCHLWLPLRKVRAAHAAEVARLARLGGGGVPGQREIEVERLLIRLQRPRVVSLQRVELADGEVGGCRRTDVLQLVPQRYGLGMVLERTTEVALQAEQFAHARPRFCHARHVAPGLRERKALAPRLDGGGVVAQFLVHHRDGLQRARLPVLVPSPLVDRDGLRVVVECAGELGLHVERVAETVERARHSSILVQLLEHVVCLLVPVRRIREASLHVCEVGEVGVAGGHFAAVAGCQKRLARAGERVRRLRHATREHVQRPGLNEPAAECVRVPERSGEPRLEGEHVQDVVEALLALKPAGLGRESDERVVRGEFGRCRDERVAPIRRCRQDRRASSPAGETSFQIRQAPASSGRNVKSRTRRSFLTRWSSRR